MDGHGELLWLHNSVSRDFQLIGSHYENAILHLHAPAAILGLWTCAASCFPDANTAAALRRAHRCANMSSPCGWACFLPYTSGHVLLIPSNQRCSKDEYFGAFSLHLLNQAVNKMEREGERKQHFSCRFSFFVCVYKSFPLQQQRKGQFDVKQNYEISNFVTSRFAFHLTLYCHYLFSLTPRPFPLVLFKAQFLLAVFLFRSLDSRCMFSLSLLTKFPLFPHPFLKKKSLPF